MLRGIVISTAGQVQIKDFPNPVYKSLGEVVGGYIDVVRPKGAIEAHLLKRNMCFVCNEEGKLQNLPVNNVGTYLYNIYNGTLFMRDVIVGNIVILKEGMTPEGMDFVSLTRPDIAFLKASLNLPINLKEVNLC
jgi:hypothetical protein